MTEEEKMLKILRKLQLAAIEAAKPKPRTIEMFVNDLKSRGRTLSHILTVAFSTRWKQYSVQIKEIYNEQSNGIM